MVYGDVVGMENAVFDGTLLYGVARALGEEVRWLRLGAASLVGGGLATLSLLPGVAPLAGVWGRLLVPLLLVSVAFGCGRRTPGRLLALFVLAFAAAGLAEGTARLIGVGGVVPYLSLPAVLVGAELAGRIRWRPPQAERIPIRLELLGREARCVALVDTGLSLTDPLSRRPVVVVEGSALASLVPSDLLEALTSGDAATLGLAADRHPEFARRLRALPFVGLGQRRGVLWGFAPDRLAVGEHAAAAARRQAAAAAEVVVGVAPHRLSADGAFQALVPPTLLGRRPSPTPRASGSVRKEKSA